MSVEPQTAEARIAKLAALERGVLHDRDEAWAEEAKPVAQRHRCDERRGIGGEVSRRDIEPLTEERWDVGVAGEEDRPVIGAETA